MHLHDGLRLSDLADAARWCLILVFALAAWEKGLTLQHRASAWHPVLIIGRWRRIHATELMAVALLADLVTTGSLFYEAALGGAFAVVLVSIYSVAGLPSHIAESSPGCRCFKGLLNTRTAKGLLVRNAGLAILSGFVIVKPPGAPTPEGVALSLPMVACLALIAGLGRSGVFAGLINMDRNSASGGANRRGKPGTKWEVNYGE
jgi:hypothetical protein